MLLIFILILSSYLTGVYGQRYVIDNDNDLGTYYAFAIDVCFKASSYPNKYLKYSCSRTGKSLQKREYQDRDCNNAITAIAWKPEELSPCKNQKFSCNGTDEYQMLSFYHSCSSYAIYIFPLANGCYCDSNITSYHSNCVNDDTEHSAGLTEYTNDITCSAGYNNNQQDLTECIVVGASQGNNMETVYAKFKSCNTSDATEIVTTVSTSADTSGLDTVWIYVIIGGGIFCLFACFCIAVFKYTGKKRNKKEDDIAIQFQGQKYNDANQSVVAPAAPIAAPSSVVMAQPDVNHMNMVNTVSIESYNVSYNEPGQIMEGDHGFEGGGMTEGGGVKNRQKNEGGYALPGHTRSETHQRYKD